MLGLFWKANTYWGGENIISFSVTRTFITIDTKAYDWDLLSIIDCDVIYTPFFYYLLQCYSSTCRRVFQVICSFYLLRMIFKYISPISPTRLSAPPVSFSLTLSLQCHGEYKMYKSSLYAYNFLQNIFILPPLVPVILQSSLLSDIVSPIEWKTKLRIQTKSY
jgi:hypothetical protein